MHNLHLLRDISGFLSLNVYLEVGSVHMEALHSILTTVPFNTMENTKYNFWNAKNKQFPKKAISN